MRKILGLFVPAIVMIFFGTTGVQAQTEVCSPGLAALSGADAEADRAVGRSYCVTVWTDTLPVTGMQARISVIGGLEVPDFLPERIGRALEVADATVPVLGGGLRHQSAIDIIVIRDGDATPEWDDEAAALATDTGDTCTVQILHLSYDSVPGLMQLEQSIAHEFFHCIQYTNLSNILGSGMGWAMEASASWFAHRAYEGLPHELVDSFDHFIVREPMSNLVYSNWLFFAWLDNMRGPEGVMTYLRSLPSAAGVEPLLDSMSEEDWGEFTLWYTDRLIRTPDGRRIRPSVRQEPHRDRVPDDADRYEVTIPRAPGRFMNHVVTVPSGVWRIYGERSTFAFWGDMDGDGEPTGRWRNMGRDRFFEIEVPCGPPQEFMVVGMGQIDAGYTYSAVFSEETCASECEAVPEARAACLIGSWEVVDATQNFRDMPAIVMMRMMALIGGGSVDDIDIQSETYRFDRDGTFVGNRAMTMAGRWNDGTQDVSAELNITENTDIGRWGATGRNLTVCVERNVMRATLTARSAEFGPQSEPLTSDEPVTDEPQVTARYTCQGNELRISASSNPFLGSGTVTLRRRANP